MITRSIDTAVGRVSIASTTVAEGDFAVSGCADELSERRRAIVDVPWTWVRQVHGDGVVVVERPGDGAGATADAVVTNVPGAAVAVTTADCSPVVLVGTTAIGVAHAGWKGLMAGVVASTASALDALGAEPVATFLGPCIQPAAYEFGAADLAAMSERFGPDVAGWTLASTPALDMTLAVGAACAEVGWPVPDRPSCTSGMDFFSHRTRGDGGRQTTVAWISPTGPAS